MTTEGIGAIVMVSDGGSSPQERLLVRAQRAAALDLIATLHAQHVTPVIVSAPALDWLPGNLDVIGEADPPGEPFHFGRRLADLITRHDLRAVMYFGGGSAPLLDGTLADMIATLILRGQGRVPGSRIPAHIALTNNVHSSDWVAISNAPEVLEIIAATERDNSLAWLLREAGEYDVRAITKLRPAVNLDLDTPADLALLAEHPAVGPQLAAVLADAPLAAVPVREVARIAATPEKNVTLIGRVAPQAWSALNAATRCWVRVFAEERGMVASGRQERGEVQSLLGEMIRAQGPHAFFETLARMTDAAIIDNRPLMVSQGHWPDDADRFASDLYQVEQVKDDWLREFTAAAAAAPIPVLLGGHSVVAGGLYALVEIINGL
ncbi:MAG: hypothetical protein JW910_08710 [Anaerolineae bacterium]|nr:hypothetical protein [Anaerolineae bacterium]